MLHWHGTRKVLPKGEIVKYLRIIRSTSKTYYTVTFGDTSSVKITEI